MLTAAKQVEAESHDDFLHRVVKQTPGFLEDYTAVCTMRLLDLQDELGVQGSLLEIGVYGGKYFSVFARTAIKNNHPLIGIDPYIHFTPEQVLEHIRPAGAIGDYKLIKALSQSFIPSDITKIAGNTRIVDIDGSHEYEDVLYDLNLCENTVTAGGILTFDDFVNVHDIGCCEALFRYFHTGTHTLVPFAYIANKLFMTTRSHAKVYKDHIEEFAMSDQTYDRSATFRQRLSVPGAGRRMVETELLGQKVLIIP